MFPEPLDTSRTTSNTSSAAHKYPSSDDSSHMPYVATKRIEPCVESISAEQAEWPSIFRTVEKTHKALNIVCTFCTTKRKLATTFDALKLMVEPHTGRILGVRDVALVIAIKPDSIKFCYVDALALQAEFRGSERPDEIASAALEPASVDSKHNSRYILHFQFIHDDLESQSGIKYKNRGKKGPGQTVTRQRVYSQKQMLDLIDRRNRRFRQGIIDFISHCESSGLQAEEELKRESFRFIPFLPREAHASVPAPGMLGLIQPVNPELRKPIAIIVDELQNSDWYRGQIVAGGRHVLAPQQAVYGDLDFVLSQDIVNALFYAKHIRRFYSHQAEALNCLHSGKHVVVATSTSSGKSLIYQLPVLHALERKPNTRALFIFPTKALAQDQRSSLKEMMGYLQGLGKTRVETYDGDTAFAARHSIREEASVILTNPDMLHVSILPHEEKWRTFLQNLEFVIVDELHHYCGLFGSHVAFLMRRLRRLCAALGNGRIKFVSCSATAANPKEHFQAVFGVTDVQVVDSDGSPSGAKEFLCWDTPHRYPGDPKSGRISTRFECARLFCQLALQGVRTIAFCRNRAHCESLVSAVKRELEALGRQDCAERIVGYRAGYTAEDRRKIERDMFSGVLLGIVATTALELGVNIGSLDCVLMWGFPFSISSLRQQTGRAGRTQGKDSLAILVGDSSSSDQRYMKNPQEILTEPNDPLRIDLENLLVREGHIQCAASEMPIKLDEDEVYFGPGLRGLCQERLVSDEQGFFHSHSRFGPYPSRLVCIRDVEDERFAVVDVTNGGNYVLEELEASRVASSIYEGCIFLHQGGQYLVREFRPDRGLAKVNRVKADWVTVQRDYTDVDPVKTEAVRTVGGLQALAFLGTIKIEQKVFGYYKEDSSGSIIDSVEVDNPPVIRYSKGMWLDVPGSALELLARRRLHIGAAIHAAEHAVIALIPNLVVGMPGDVRTECKDALKEFSRRETQRKRPGRLSFYDAKGGAGGSGTTTKAFEFVDVLLRQALKRISVCHCSHSHGCLECVAPETCRKHQVVMSKAGGWVILMSLLGEAIDEESLPMGPEEDIPAGVETVVLAQTMPLPSEARQ